MTQESALGRHLLSPHPVSERGAMQGLVREIAVDVRRSGGWLLLTWQLSADLTALRLPEAQPPVRTDGLWRHTCFEAFVGRASGEYWEYNFSPSTAWAAYQFSGYRAAVQPNLQGVAPVIKVHTGPDALRLDVKVDLSWLRRSPSEPGLRLGLSAVIEDRARVLSYWALRHPTGKPDFHHADGFAIDLG